MMCPIMAGLCGRDTEGKKWMLPPIHWMKEHGMPEPNRIAPQLLSFAEFTALVERYQRELYVFLCGLVAQTEQARDLLQDTFCDAWRAAKRGAAPLVMDGPPDEIRRWLFHAAYCRAISALRRRR